MRLFILRLPALDAAGMRILHVAANSKIQGYTAGLKKMKQLFAFLSICAFAASSASAQVTVTKTVAEVSPLDLSGLVCSADSVTSTFRRALESDLIRSGWFNLVAAGGRGTYSIVGKAGPSGAGLEAQITAYHVPTMEKLLSQGFACNNASDAHRLAHKAADAIVLAITGKPGISSTRIAMVGNRTGKKEIYICDADGENLRQLTNEKSLCLTPRWSPDANSLLFVSYRSGFPDVILANLTTRSMRRLANYPGLNAGGAMSPDSREVALVLSKDGNPDIYIKDLSSGRLTRLTATKSAAEASPSWSPDGRRLVFVSDAAGVGSPQLYMLDRAGGQPQRITGQGSENVDPDWGQNNFIVYSSRRGGRYQLCVLNPDTLEARQITGGNMDYEEPSWAPDGRHVVCTVTQSNQTRIFIIDILTNTSVALTPENKSEKWFSPKWSPK